MNHYYTFFICGLGLTLSACTKKEAAVTETVLESFPVRVSKVSSKDLEETLTLTGSIKARNEAVIFSRVPGKLQSYHVKEGDAISKGGTIAYVERDEVGVTFRPAPVPSTLSGVIARVYLDRGADVTPTTPIASIVDQSQLSVKADVPERYLGKIRMGQEVRVSSDSNTDQVFLAKISRLSPVVDPNTRSAYLEATLSQKSLSLKPGMFTKLVVVIAKHSKAITIPLEGLNQKTVYVVENGIAHLKNVSVGIQTDTDSEITQGLHEGESVVTFGSFGLKEGSTVEVLP